MIAALAPFALLTLCTLPWLLLASRRFGARAAGLGAFAVVPGLVLAVFCITPAIAFDPVTTLLVVAGAGGIVGVVLVLRDRSALRAPARTTVARWLAASVGAVAWLGSLAVAQLLPNANPLSWAMNGDGANNVHLARQLLAQHGLTSAFSTPVPLANELEAIAFRFGREHLSKSALLEHDLIAFGAVWALCIAATAVLLGLVVSSLLDSQRPVLVGLAATVGSLLATTWFVVGLPIESGYSNVHVALPFALASWLALMQSQRMPLVSSVLLMLFGFLLLAVWTPLVLLPGAFLVAIALRNWSTIRVAQARQMVIPLISALPFIAWFLLESLPGFVSVGDALTTVGHGYPFTGWILVVAAVVAVSCAIALRRGAHEPLADGVVALTAAAALGFAAMIYLAHTDDEPWLDYYPTKFTWLFTVVFGAIALSLLFRLLADRRARRPVVLAFTAVVGAAAIAVCSIGPAPDRLNFVIEQPLQRMLVGHVWHDGDRAVDTILAHSNSSTVLWDSGDPDEAFINFWLLEFNGGDSGHNGSLLRNFSVFGYRELRDTGTYTVGELQQLCDVAGALPPPVAVYTADPDLREAVAGLCPLANATVLVEASPSRE